MEQLILEPPAEGSLEDSKFSRDRPHLYPPSDIMLSVEVDGAPTGRAHGKGKSWD
jgi:hypothetical protein